MSQSSDEAVAEALSRADQSAEHIANIGVDAAYGLQAADDRAALAAAYRAQSEALAAAQAEASALREVVDGIAIYAEVTLSTKAEGSGDIEWLVEGYQEIRNRARAALSEPKP